MTDFEKIKNYYKHFDEKNRLQNDNSGKLEFLMTMGVLEKYLPAVGEEKPVSSGVVAGSRSEAVTGADSIGKCARDVSVLDLGGGAGAYAFPLAERGYKVTLADLSEDLIAQAKAQKEELAKCAKSAGNTANAETIAKVVKVAGNAGINATNCYARAAENLVACDVANATDLSCYEAHKFDVVLLFGPLYHLLENAERSACIKEIHRVLKPGGKVFASFIPYLSGSIALLSRFYWRPEQVDINTLSEVFKSGQFKNLSDGGFQEGYYPTSEEIENLFDANGFEKIALRSIRGFGYEKEDMIYKFENTPDFEKIIGLINDTAADKSIVEMCGHAIYVGSKK